MPDGFWTFADVQDRLVEALITCWRQPDRERGWMNRGASDGPWHLVMPEAGDYDGGRAAAGERVDAAIRPASLTRREIAEMEEAFGWVGWLATDDRKVVALAVADLASGRREVSWSRMLRPMGLKHGADGLRMRYGRAITAICNALNGGNPRDLLVKGVNVQDRNI